MADSEPFFYTPPLTTSDSLTITISFPHPTEQDMPIGFRLLIQDSSNTAGTLPAPFNADISLIPFIPNSFSTTVSWNVESNGVWRFIVERTETTIPKAFVLYDLKVEKADGTVIIQQSDILRRNYIYHRITLDAPSTIEVGNSFDARNIQLFPMSSAYFVVDQPFSPVSPDTSTTLVRKYTLSAGSYGILFGYPKYPGSAFYQSNENICPITPGYTDVRRVFHPCSDTAVLPPNPSVPH